MDQKKLVKIKFGSFISLCVKIAISVGIVIGLLLFIVSLFGSDVNVGVGFTTLQGIPGGMAAIIVVPLIFSILGAVSGLVGYFPFNLILKIFGAISIKGQWD